MVVLLALGSAVCFGLGDFVGGAGAKRSNPFAVVAVMTIVAVLLLTAYAVALGGSPRPVDHAWGALAGLANGFGSAFLYRGLAHGRMAVVAPVSAVGAASLPVLVGVGLGERPSLLVWLGVAVGLPGIWLVSREPVEGTPTRSGLRDGILAGVGFGGLFVALAQIPEEAGVLPLAVNEGVALLAIAAVARALGGSARPVPAAWPPGVLAGVLIAAASVLFLAATQQGLLAVAAILASLYPAVTVLLAALVLRERIHRGQGVGLALCLLSVALVASP